MARSMTGFGSAEGSAAGGRLQIEIRTVNHRHFSAQVKLPTPLQGFEEKIREMLRTRIHRGHVTVGARWTEERPRESQMEINLQRAREITEALTRLKQELDLPGEVDLGYVARQPEVLQFGMLEPLAVDTAEVETLLAAALDDVIGMRDREGRVLASELERILDVIEERTAAIEEEAPSRLVSERDRLRKSVSELLDGKKANEDRLAQEIAILADKLDVTEELVRLRAHVTAVRETLSEDVAVGRRLGFLAQEMLREINTTGSKANNAAISHHVVAMKGELEKFREQLENLE